MAKARLRNLGLLAGLFALGAAGWWSLRGGGAHGDEAAMPRADTASTEERPEAAMAAPAAGAAERVALAETAPEEEQELPAEPVPTTWPLSAGRPAEIPIEGTIVVTAPDGVEHPYESGSMNIVVWRGRRGEHQPVEIVNGRWKSTVAEDAELSFSEIALGGLRAVSQHEDNLSIPASRLLAVRARWPPASTLRVRSAKTHEDLAGVDLVAAEGWGPSGQHPGLYGPDELLASHVDSPIDLGRVAAGRYARTLFARAQGYAWGKIEVDLDAGGDRLLDLGPGGWLQVVLRGSVPADASLRLRVSGAETSPPLLDVELMDAEQGWKDGIEFDSLPPGECTVSVELGDSYNTPLVLASAPVEIIAGGLARVGLDVVEPEKLARTPVWGTLVLDPAWGEIVPELKMQSVGALADGRSFRMDFSQGDLRPVPGAANTWKFDAGVVPVGSYEFEVSPTGFAQPQEIDAATHELRLEVPAPAVAVVRVIDESGSAVPELTALLWQPVRAGGGSIESVARNPATGRFEIRAPSGRITIFVLEDGLTGNDTYDLAPGRHELDLVVSRTVGFALSLGDGETPLPWPWDWQVEPKEVGGDGAGIGWTVTLHGTRIAVTRPGRYRFTLPAVPGYEPIPEQEVLVPEQGFAEHVVQLVRSP